MATRKITLLRRCSWHFQSKDVWLMCHYHRTWDSTECSWLSVGWWVIAPPCATRNNFDSRNILKGTGAGLTMMWYRMFSLSSHSLLEGVWPVWRVRRNRIWTTDRCWRAHGAGGAVVWIGTAEGRETDNIQSHVSHLKLSLPPSSGFIPQLPWLGGENNLQKNVSRPAETQTAYSIFCSCYQLKIIYEILVEWKVQVKGNIKEIAYLKFQGTFAVGLECSGLLHPDTIFARHAQTRLSGLRSAGPGSSCL